MIQILSAIVYRCLACQGRTLGALFRIRSRVADQRRQLLGGLSLITCIAALFAARTRDF